MPVTILVADDSATMRSILEMTFAGEDARVVTVDGGASALEKALDLHPDIVIADLSMEMDGYEVARAIKSKLAGTPVIVLSSQHTPYDEAKGRDAGVDDQIVKPFDTQNVIDRVLRLAAAPRAAAAAAAAVAPPPAHPYRESQQAGPRVQTAPVAAPVVPPRPPQPASAAPPGTVAAPRPGMPRTTIAFGSTPVGPPSAPAAPRSPTAPFASPPVAAPRPPAMPVPAAPPVVHHAPAPAAHAAPVAAHAAPVAARPAAVVEAATNALSGKLGGLGLTAQQVDAVLALSREVIERVVWEVVPDLAETLIREELKRLTAEG